MVGPALSLSTLGISASMVLLAAVIRGFTGFGFSISAVPLLSLVMLPAQAVPLVLLLQLVVSLNGLRAAIRICDWRSIRVLALGALLMTPLGVWGLAHLPAAPVRLCIGVIALMATVVLWRGVRLPAISGGGVFLFGVLAGLFNGLAAMPGPPVIAYYLAAPVSTDTARASMIVFFLATSVIALVPLATLGMVNRSSLILALLGLPAVWLGSSLGAWLYRGAPERRYRGAALVLLAIAAVLAALRASLDLDIPVSG